MRTPNATECPVVAFIYRNVAPLLALAQKPIAANLLETLDFTMRAVHLPLSAVIRNVRRKLTGKGVPSPFPPRYRDG
jgi:hypothetical protein